MDIPLNDAGAELLRRSPSRNVSVTKSVTVIVTLAGINFLNTMRESLMLWPAAVYSFAAGCLLPIFGAVADVVGAKLMWVAGSYLCIVFTAAVGLSRTGVQIIVFRTCAGISMSACLPTAMAVITKTFPKGGWRNVAFLMNGIGFPLGYALCLVLGGIFTDTIGWRWGYYTMAIINFCLSTAAISPLPSVYQPSEKKWARRLAEDIDWIGTIIMSAALGLLLYVLAMTTSSYTKIGDPANIALLAVAIALLVAFPCWMNRQTAKGRPALIPNRLWQKFLVHASLNTMRYFIMLYFQKVQGVSALQSSLRFLPHVVMGTAVNVAAAWLVSRVEVQTIGAVSAVITAGVFSEIGQIGNAVGLAVAAAIAASVTEHSGIVGHAEEARIAGYRAAFWAIFAATGAVFVIVLWGLRQGGTVGKKDE
ncbi:MFS general substrate transporter [Colletotrichum falcatum]|nr:MFS general substrate transporter [Colletotrichum falcatum]